MKTNGKLIGVSKDYFSSKLNITFQIDGCTDAELDRLQEIGELEITADKPKKHRSLDANAMLWACIGDIAKAMNPPADKWDVYLTLLKRYGTYTYICVKPAAVEAIKRQWRECEVVGNVNINGQESVQLLCYYGSSTYTPEEMGKLIDGTISEMEQMGIPRPIPKDLRRALETYEEKWNAEHFNH